MADKILLDASIVISLYHIEDSMHDEACAFFELHEDTEFLLYESTIREILTVLTYKKWSSFALESFNLLREWLDLTIPKDEFENELRFFSELWQKISFFDAALLYHSKKDGYILATFDRALQKLSHKS